MKKQYCIVTPFQKSRLSDYEKLSYKTILKVFNNKDKYLVTFPENKLKLNGYINQYFHKSYFENIKSYNKLCLDKSFYERFKDYKYILICHFDVIVLSKDFFDTIFKKKISYIGAPTGRKNLFDRNRKKLWGRRFNCNGGFSLRKIEDFLTVLNSQSMNNIMNKTTLKACIKIGLLKNYKLLYQSSKQNKNKMISYFISNFDLNEDTFWTYFAIIFNKKFTLPTLEEANHFAFDGEPNFFYKKNNYKLPMALHGYHEYLKFLKKINYKIDYVNNEN